MPPVTADSSLPSGPDFAGLLAALTAPVRKAEPLWNDDGLADDVATLSYETALRNHARYKASDMGDGPLTRAWSNDGKPMRAEDPCAAFEQDRKSASITIRMSKAECEQLKRRASEAGLSMSSYLRSCTFEAEALRAQVKEALAELRTGNGKESFDTRAKISASRFGWLRRLRLKWHSSERVART